MRLIVARMSLDPIGPDRIAGPRCMQGLPGRLADSYGQIANAGVTESHLYTVAHKAHRRPRERIAYLRAGSLLPELHARAKRRRKRGVRSVVTGVHPHGTACAASLVLGGV